jgi:hypothetical protein
MGKTAGEVNYNPPGCNRMTQRIQGGCCLAILDICLRPPAMSITLVIAGRLLKVNLRYF